MERIEELTELGHDIGQWTGSLDDVVYLLPINPADHRTEVAILCASYR